MKPRSGLFAALALILLAWGAWQIYAGWGLVTLDFENAPVGKVLAAIGKQGGIEVASNLDPSSRVTIKVTRVPAVEALDIVAVRTDASWRLAYLGAKEAATIEKALGSFRAGQEAEGWASFGGGGFNFVQPQSGAAMDLRLVEWTPTGGGELTKLLGEAAESTGVYLAAPSDWSPQVDKPVSGPMRYAVPELFRQAGGVCREVFLVRGSPGGGDGEDGGGWRGGRSWIGSASRGGPRNEGRDQGGRGQPGPGGRENPESAAKRAEAQIKLLPAGEQEQARKDVAMMREFWQSVRDLPEDQRRAKAREFFDRPDVQQRMDDRRLAREAKMTPQQRIERAQRYWNRKAEAKYRGGTQ